YLDEEAADGTPVAKLPSYTAMMDLAAEDRRVKVTLGREQLEAAGADFGPADTEWLEQLRRHPKTGQILCEAPNIKLILQHDPNLKGKFALDDFAHRAVVAGPVPWRDLERGRYWGDHDDAGLRNYLAEVYEVKGPGVIYDAFLEVLVQNAYHPVRDYLGSLAWDGVPRVDTLLVDYLGAADTRYTRAVTRKMLAAAVARVFAPGCKFDHVLVLVGPQGVGKSHLIKKLGREWYSDSLNTMQGKEAYELLQGVWLMELGELAATRRAEIEVVKHFISKQEDQFRVAYGRHTSVFPRQCVFFGTTNEPVFLKDRTGNRRFWPVPVRKGPHPKSLWADLTDAAVDQVWAEALALWRAGETLYLDAELEAEALELQAMHAEESERAGMIQEYLETPLPENWDSMDIPERRQYIHGGDFGETPRGTVRRDRVCAMEVWVELFNGDPRTLSPMTAREINDILRQVPGWKPYIGGTQSRLYFGRHYGRQRAFVRAADGRS
ncbi:MAG: VapE domain-containing protein, partial [Bacillota bacterium]